MAIARTDFIATSLAAAACAAGPARARAGGPDIVVDDPDLFPESVAYDAATERFYVGSLRHGRITAIDASGKATPLTAPDPAYSSIFGIFTSRDGAIVYGCAANPGVGAASNSATVGGVCRLVAFDARTGSVARDVDLIAGLSGKHLPNDGAVADDGTIYVTDSLAPILFRVSADGHAEAFARDAGFAPPAGPGAGLDGIAIARTGTIVVNHFSHGTFFRIDPASRAVARVAVAGDRTFPGADGMRFLPSGRLVVAQSTLAGPAARNAILVLASNDDWRTAAVAREIPLRATTYQTAATPAGAYGIQGRLEVLFADPKRAAAPSFTLVGLPAGLA